MRLMVTLASTALIGLLCVATGVSAQSTETGQPRTKAKNEQLICQNMQETGSIARQRRQCFTRAEWDRIAEAARARGQRLQSDMASGMVSN